MSLPAAATDGARKRRSPARGLVTAALLTGSLASHFISRPVGLPIGASRPVAWAAFEPAMPARSQPSYHEKPTVGPTAVELLSATAPKVALAVASRAENGARLRGAARMPAVTLRSAVCGLVSRSNRTTLLVCHPKTVLPGGDPTVLVGEPAALEIIAIPGRDGVRFRVLARGQPIAQAQGTVRLPNERHIKVETDREGFTPAFPEPGRYGAYIRWLEDRAGQHLGQPFHEVRHYASLTLVMPSSGTAE